MLTIERKRMLHLFKLAREAGAYDELPLLQPGIDPQLYLSRNDRPQPFYLLLEHDSVLIQLSGTGKVEFKDAQVRWHGVEPGDFVYIPAGTPHRILPTTECVQVRVKAEHAGLEAVAWYCTDCGSELYRNDWDTAQELPQEGFTRSCLAFNASPRRCSRCGAEHPAVSLDGTRWPEIAAALRQTP